jgi:hypothetical protein
MVIIPFALVTPLSSSESEAFFLLSTVGTFSLFPLAFEIQVKVYMTTVFVRDLSNL